MVAFRFPFHASIGRFGICYCTIQYGFAVRIGAHADIDTNALVHPAYSHLFHCSFRSAWRGVWMAGICASPVPAHHAIGSCISCDRHYLGNLACSSVFYKRDNPIRSCRVIRAGCGCGGICLVYYHAFIADFCCVFADWRQRVSCHGISCIIQFGTWTCYDTCQARWRSSYSDIDIIVLCDSDYCSQRPSTSFRFRGLHAVSQLYLSRSMIRSAARLRMLPSRESLSARSLSFSEARITSAGCSPSSPSSSARISSATDLLAISRIFL